MHGAGTARELPPRAADAPRAAASHLGLLDSCRSQIIVARLKRVRVNLGRGQRSGQLRGSAGVTGKNWCPPAMPRQSQALPPSRTLGLQRESARGLRSLAQRTRGARCSGNKLCLTRSATEGDETESSPASRKDFLWTPCAPWTVPQGRIASTPRGLAGLAGLRAVTVTMSPCRTDTGSQHHHITASPLRSFCVQVMAAEQIFSGEPYVLSDPPGSLLPTEVDTSRPVRWTRTSTVTGPPWPVRVKGLCSSLWGSTINSAQKCLQSYF